MKPKLNDVVRLLDELTNESLAAGTIGVVVVEWSEPEEAYEIEFVDGDGSAVAQVVLRPSQFCVVSGGECR